LDPHDKMFDKAPALTENAAIPLVVDVDGTLIKTDLLHEAILQMVATQPFQAWRMFVWLAKGKAAFKTALADRVDPGIASIPLREEVVALISAAQTVNRPVYLASASDRRYVEQLAARLGGIKDVFSTDVTMNLAGTAKAERLVAAFGPKRFDYVGDANVDFPVWAQARKVLALANGLAIERRLLAAFPDVQVVARPRSSVNDYVKTLRPHQWAKNLLVFLPMIAGHQFGADTMLSSMLAFVSFCVAASSTYLINDLLDLPGDRDHPHKRSRVFAAGGVPLWHGVLGAGLLVVLALAFGAVLQLRFLAILALYLLTTLAYSFVLKRKVMVDVVVLGGLYTLRVLGGVAATGAEQSPWLLMFSLFFFLSLAIVKRCSELTANLEAGKGAAVGRGYRVEDLRVLLPLAAAAGYGAIFVITLYLSSPEVKAQYVHPTRLWLICPLLIYWISRVLILTNRNELNHDPIVFAITDRVSWATALCVAAVIAVAIH
jgi:4-hydroxybenzoate polyprenyltransferase